MAFPYKRPVVPTPEKSALLDKFKEAKVLRQIKIAEGQRDDLKKQMEKTTHPATRMKLQDQIAKSNNLVKKLADVPGARAGMEKQDKAYLAKKGKEAGEKAVQTGAKGGRYYIAASGEKIYVK